MKQILSLFMPLVQKLFDTGVKVINQKTIFGIVLFFSYIISGYSFTLIEWGMFLALLSINIFAVRYLIYLISESSKIISKALG